MKIDMKNKSNAFYSILVFILCCLRFIIPMIVFVLLKDGQPVFEGDTPQYIDFANHYLRGDFLWSDGNRTPGYPLMLALIYALGGNNVAVVILQTLLSALRIYLTWKILIELKIGQKLVLLGTVMQMGDLLSYRYDYSILTECLFCFLVLLTLWFIVLYYSRAQKSIYLCIAGIILNYALLTRPVLTYFNMLLCIVLIIMTIKKVLPVSCCITFLISFIVAYFGWSYINYINYSNFSFSIQGTWLMDSIVEEIEKISGKHFDSESTSEVIYILKHLPSFILLEIKGFLATMFVAGKIENYLPANYHILVFLFKSMLNIFMALVLIFYFAGIFINHKKAVVIRWFIFCLSAYLAIVCAPWFTYRYRIQFLQLLIIGATFDLIPVIHWFFARFKKRI
jgi:4-amino-4-deoxy-L-arabinose transferase-like glycosyltransferase